jgi:serine/threonine protein kinase
LNIAPSSSTYFENYIFSGYMPPEYAGRGHFSTKLDVFSYGVIVLEIVSGKKNTKFSDPEYYQNLLGYVSIMTSQT